MHLFQRLYSTFLLEIKVMRPGSHDFYQGYEAVFTWVLSRLWGRVQMSPSRFEAGFTWVPSRLWDRVHMTPIKVMRPGSHESYQGYEAGFTWDLSRLWGRVHMSPTVPCSKPVFTELTISFKFSSTEISKSHSLKSSIVYYNNLGSHSNFWRIFVNREFDK